MGRWRSWRGSTGRRWPTSRRSERPIQARSPNLSASGLAVRLGTELPQILHVPPDVASHAAGEDAIALANGYMFDAPARLAPSQELRLRNGMATRADGKWA